MLKLAFSQAAVLSLFLAASVAGQSVVPDSPPATGESKPGLFDRVISNQKKNEEALEVYELIDATHNAFLFTFVAREPRADHMLSKYRMEPNPAFKPTTRFTSMYPKVRGFIWVDESAEQLARIEGEVTEDISVGLFLGKIYKGSHFMQERYEVAPGLWLASFSQYDFDGRKLFSGFAVHERTFYKNYRYIGPPKEALVVIRKDRVLSDLAKPASAAAHPSFLHRST